MDFHKSYFETSIHKMFTVMLLHLWQRCIA